MIALEIEPGRYLVAESGYLVSEIRAIKKMGEQHVLSARRRVQQSGPADSLWLVPPDVDRAARPASGRSVRSWT